MEREREIFIGGHMTLALILSCIEYFNRHKENNKFSMSQNVER